MAQSSAKNRIELGCRICSCTLFFYPTRKAVRVIAEKKLTPKQKRFVDEYLIDLNATQAAIRAGYSPKTANEQGARLLANVSIAQTIQKAMQDREQRTEITQDRVLQEYARLAFYDPRKLFQPDGTPKPIEALDDDTAAALAGLEVREEFEGTGQDRVFTGYTKKYKLANKLGALDSLARHLDMFDGKGQEAEKESGEPKPFELPARLIAPAFAAVNLDILQKGHREYVLPGGRGSTKSSFLSLKVTDLIKNNPDMNALILRKVGNTLRDSVFSQMLWAIEQLGLLDEFRVTVSPMEIVYKPTGQQIMFRGADDPLKLKSVKPKRGYIGIVWFEELDQFSGDAECRSIQQSATRGGDEAFIFKSFNPPKTRNNWANQYIELPKESRLVTRSDYRSVPRTWLGKSFLDEAEYLREINPAAYEHEYLGMANGNGGMVLENVVSEEISDTQIKQFDHIYNGVDWGYYPDPWVFNRMHYDAARRILYIFDELQANKKGNRETADMLIKHGITYADRITADSAEPKSVADYKSFGLNCRGAEKGPGSVDYSMKWLQSLVKIVIDPKRCPNTWEEFSRYEYERTKDGEIVSGYPDSSNHHIDACRYAMETVWKKRGQ